MNNYSLGFLIAGAFFLIAFIANYVNISDFGRNPLSRRTLFWLQLRIAAAVVAIVLGIITA